jgi:spermidine synthase
MIGFVCLAVLVAACAFLAGRRAGEETDAAPKRSVDAASPGWRERLTWVGLSFVPSSLLVAVTAHISTDVAAMPLLWVAPLALFLLTFVLAFRRQPLLASAAVRHVQIGGTALVLLSIVFFPGLLIALALHLGMFFVNALMCHAALYEKRPSSDRLTEFYVWVSFGGVLGGIFCGLLAPFVFSTVVEYPILLIAALFGHRTMRGGNWRPWEKDGGRAFLACAVVLLVGFALARTLVPADLVSPILAVLSLGALAAAWRAPKQLAPLAITALLAAAILNGDGSAEHFRSFFGVHKIKRSDDGQYQLLLHGTTLHGAMRLKNADGSPATGRPELMSYYVSEGAIASGISLVREAHGGMLPSVAAIGLGTGSLACHIAAGEAWTFFEIDPEVLRIATDATYFRFLRDCAGNVPVVMGDARLKLEEQSGGQALIVVDAFSSDAIPSHLLTKEAIGLYLSKLTENGAILFHISNRHLDLRRVVARTAAEHGLATFVRSDAFAGPMGPSRAPSVVAVVTRDPAYVGRMAADNLWRWMQPDLSRRPWTDDFSNIVQAIVDKHSP